MATVETQIASARAYLAQLEKRKLDVDARKKKFGDKPIPPALERESENIDGEVRKNTELVAQKQRELVAVSARYDADKARWRELKAQADANEAAVRGAGRPTVIGPGRLDDRRQEVVAAAPGTTRHAPRLPRKSPGPPRSAGRRRDLR